MADETTEIGNGWVRDAEGRLRRATVHRMGRRRNGWDYCAPCIYEITIVLADRRSKALGRLVVRNPAACAADGERTGRPAACAADEGRTGNPAACAVGGGRTGSLAACAAGEKTGGGVRDGGGVGEWLSIDEARVLKLEPDQVEARVERSALGAAIFAHFRRIAEFTPEIRPLYCEVMPDHLHLILQVLRPMKRPLGNAIAGFKTGCEKIYAKMGGKGQLFAEGFVDEILSHQGQLGHWFNYLKDNPRRLAIKTLFPWLFKRVCRLGVDLWLVPQAGDGRGARRFAPQAGNGGGDPQLAPKVEGEGVGQPPRALARGYFSALGNRFLLGRPLAQVQVSRRFFGYKRVAKPGVPAEKATAFEGRAQRGDSRRPRGLKIVKDEKGEPIVEFSTPEFEARREELFAAAKRGAVLLSPCVSDGERQIAREALAAGLPLITMANKGFSPLQKPSGRYFDACADGRLLMLAPAAWPYQPGEKPMTRFDATAMNRLCQWIAGENAAEINYHGMKPSNVDELAFAAACVSRGERRERGGRE